MYCVSKTKTALEFTSPKFNKIQQSKLPIMTLDYYQIARALQKRHPNFEFLQFHSWNSQAKIILHAKEFDFYSPHLKRCSWRHFPHLKYYPCTNASIARISTLLCLSTFRTHFSNVQPHWDIHLYGPGNRLRYQLLLLLVATKLRRFWEISHRLIFLL